MKNTVKLILIIFFSIMYSQNIDLTGTSWEATLDGNTSAIFFTPEKTGMILFTNKNSGIGIQKSIEELPFQYSITDLKFVISIDSNQYLDIKGAVDISQDILETRFKFSRYYLINRARINFNFVL